ncbi:MmcQ/YjbR family DNA-binding protein [Myroides sp. M-43]|uniref:MmcQ/YjbR family DNA-binding protein n=1 Tax=Myroides oncorhynchi TaxID=2893756 RepID=UPI001E5A6367|nr:MmcQ/YjbR family DNA-binding protein [Myroides oncorhynchi]MCC9042470.1 MmcQ/YjbR family DNA-binding protein [Myroides oncorhynchi]
MDINVIYDYCLSKKGTTEEFPFDEETLTFKIGGKIYLLLNLTKWEQGNRFINLKCNPERAEELRADYNEILPGYHMSKKHWNSVILGGSVQWGLLKELIDHSYELVFNSLTKKLKEEINAQQ